MSIDINWPTFTTGEDGARLALHIRDFIHDKFQRITLPKFIQSVQVVSFDFGSVAPDIEIKSITDPYPEFYENDFDDDDEDDEERDGEEDDMRHESGGQAGVFDEDYELRIERERRRRERRQLMGDFVDSVPSTPGGSLHQNQQQQQYPGGMMEGGTPRRPGIAGFRSPFSPGGGGDWPGGGTTPLFPFSTPSGATSNLHYFHSALSSGFSGNSPSPLPFGPPFGNGGASGLPGWGMGERTNSYGSGVDGSFSSPTSPSGEQSPSFHHSQNQSFRNHDRSPSRRYYSDDELEPPAPPLTPPPLRNALHQLQTPTRPIPPTATSTPPRPLLREPRDDDMQIIARVRYIGDVRMELTTELLLDYPARSFVSLPVRLVVTGMSFDGLACLAYIGKKLHFCFLEDDSADNASDGVHTTTTTNTNISNAAGSLNGATAAGTTGVATGGRFGGMLKEIKVESEIGEKGKGKQVLKNVGKVERFVLEQVRKIFEEEFVFPSSWTFLV
ncbi:hypothetical protein DFH27DRAFT_574361 [Peziza echinospora]|nr:hypothetical protein DFH27DRAFT_574361 [Peziza echinospora]